MGGLSLLGVRWPLRFRLLTLPLTQYGYHNRHRIEVSDEEPHDLSSVHKATIAGTVAVPFVRMLYDWQLFV
jgi:hypothetical protein